MSPPRAARTGACVPWATALLALALAVSAVAGTTVNQTEVKLHKDIYTVQGVKLTPLFIHDGRVLAQVDKLLQQEAELAELEATLAADLSRLEDLVAADREKEQRTWASYFKYYNGLAAMGAAKGIIKRLMAAPGMVSLHLACSDIGRKIDRLAAQRHTLEEKYFASLGGVGPEVKATRSVKLTATPKQPGAPRAGSAGAGGKAPEEAKVFFGLDEGVQDKIIVHLRARMKTVQHLRRNAIENLLLANRWAREGSFPSAVLERTADWLTSDTSAVKKLEEQVKAKKFAEEELQLFRSHKEELARKIDERVKWLKAGEGPFRTVDGKKVDLGTNKKLDAATRDKMAARGEKRAKKLREQAAALKVQVDKLSAEIKALDEKIKQAKLGYKVDTDDKKGKTPAAPAAGNKTAGGKDAGGKSAAGKDGGKADKDKKDKEVADDTVAGGLAKLAGSALDPRFAELVVRRRIYKRASREAAHLFGVAEKFADLRRVQYETQRKEMVALGFDPPPPVKLHMAYIDKGYAIITGGEAAKEDAFLGQLDYFAAVTDKYNKFGELPVESDEFTTQATKHAVDSLSLAMGFASGLASALGDQVKDVVNRGGVVHWKTALDDAHGKLLKERGDRDKKSEFLLGAIGKSGADLASYFKLKADDKPEKYKPTTIKKKITDPVELILEDKDFHTKLDGGLRRIISSENIALKQRLATEYMIAYEKGKYTLRDLWRMNKTMKGLDLKTGMLDTKLLWKPITLASRALRAAYSSLYSELEIERYMGRRKTELDFMVVLYKHLQDVDFNLHKFLLKHPAESTQVKVHFRLYVSHPEYRRFWHTVAKERHIKRQNDATSKGKKGAPWAQKAARSVRTTTLGDVAPRQRMLATAHWEDAQDKMQLYDYKGALQSLLSANKLDSQVVSWREYRALQNQMAWWAVGSDVGQLALQLGDQFVWQCITAGFSKAVSGYVDDLVGILPAKRVAAPTTWKGWAAAKATDFGNMLWGQINPIAPFLNIQTLMDDGLAMALGQTVGKFAGALAQDELRDELLIKQWNMDPEHADKVAGLLWNLVEDGIKRYGQHYISKTAAYKKWSLGHSVEKLKRLQARMKTPPSDIAGVLRKGKEAWFWQRWLARRRAMAVVQLMELRNQIEALQDDLAFSEASKHVKRLGRREIKRRPGEEEAEFEARKKREQEEAQRGIHASSADRAKRFAENIKRLKYAWVREALGTEELTPDLVQIVMSTSGFDSAKAGKFLDGDDVDDDELWRQAESAGKFLNTFGPRLVGLFSKLGTDSNWPPDERQKWLDAVDAARRTIHLQSLNHVSRLLEEGDLRYLNSVADAYHAEQQKDHGTGDADPPSKVLDPKRLAAVLRDIMYITSTGSAGHIGREAGKGEYRKVKSDLDYTVVLRNSIKPPITAAERVALEFMFRASFNAVSGGLHAKTFDAAIMVDEKGNWHEGTVSQQGHEKVADMVDGADAATLRKYSEDFDRALAAQEADFTHEERYQSVARRRSLVYLTGLGDDVMIPEGDGKRMRFRRHRKADLAKNAAALGKLPQDVQDFVTNKHAKLEEWQALGIAIDDFGFKGKKLPRLLRGVSNPDGTSKPFDDYVKEDGKRNIRAMKAFLATTPTGRKMLNELPKKLLDGDTPTHGTLCDIMLKVIDAGEATALGPDLGRVKRVVTQWKDIKLGSADADAIVRSKNPAALADGPGSPAYRKAFGDAMEDWTTASDAIAKQSMWRGGRKLAALFGARTQAREDSKIITRAKRLRGEMGNNPTAAQKTEMKGLMRQLGLPEGAEATQAFSEKEEIVALRIEVCEKAVKHRLRPYSFWQSHLGGHHSDAAKGEAMRKTVYDVIGAAGADKDEYKRTCEWMKKAKRGGKKPKPATPPAAAGGGNNQSRVPRHLWHAQPVRLAA